MTKFATLIVDKRGNVIIDSAEVVQESENIVCITIHTRHDNTQTHMYGKGLSLPGIGVSRVNADGSTDKDLSTIISFLQYPGWDVWFATSRGGEIFVCLNKPVQH